MVFKVRQFVNIKILKSIYYAIFDCHLNYASTVWGQNINSMNRLIIMQKKLSILWVLNAENPFFRHEIIILPDKILMENFLFISESINFDLSPIFNHWFTCSSDSYNYETQNSSKGMLKVKTVKTKKYGREAMIMQYHHGTKFKRYFISCTTRPFIF